MDYVNLGPTGLKVSRLCLGTMTFGSRKWREWVLEEEESRPYIRRALELGVNFFDTADMYGDTRSEELLGEALGARRDQAVIATKFGWRIDDQRHGAKPAYVRRALRDGVLGYVLKDAADEELLEAVWQFRRNYEAAVTVKKSVPV